MFEEEAFVLPDSFEEDDIDIFAELGVVNNRPVAAKRLQGGITITRINRGFKLASPKRKK